MNPSPKSSVRATVRALLFAALLLGTPLSLLAANAGDPVATCGTITGNASCPTFQPDGGGLYLINDLGGFPAGTRVYIEGSFGSPCNEICLLLIPAPCVLVKVIRACDPPPETFEGCGTINGGEGCPTFLADTGTIYFLSDLGGLEPGTRTYMATQMEAARKSPAGLSIASQPRATPATTCAGQVRNRPLAMTIEVPASTAPVR